MARFIFIRLLQAVPVLGAVALLTFLMARAIPGGPFDAERKVSPEVMAQIERYYGLDLPLHEQFGRYVGNLVLRGDLGPSMRYEGRTVNELIGGAFPASLELALWALVVALTVGLAAGMVAALFRNRWPDQLTMSVGMVGICLPTFVLGPLLIYVLGLELRWFNVAGWAAPEDRVLPAVTLGLYYAAYVARLTRAGLLEVLSMDFIRTARAKGASEGRVLFRHALRGGVLPVVAFLGPAVAGLVTGSFVVESIFQIPGLGQHFVSAAFNRDYTMILGTVLFYAAFLILLNLLVDIVQAVLNPRVKLA